MSNFEPKLEDATEKELRYMVNELDFRVVPLASDELTRRTLDKLQKTIEEANEHSGKLERANYRLQMIMVVLTSLGTLVILFPILKSIFQWILPIITKSLKLTAISINSIDALSALISGAISALILIGSKLNRKSLYWIKHE